MSPGAIEGARARPVVAKSDRGHGADTSLLDGYLEDIASINRHIRKVLQGRPESQDWRWQEFIGHLRAAVEVVGCAVCGDRVGVHDTGLDGRVCHECFTRVPASGPDDDAAYEEAVGK